jgi:hypothetical protein
MNEPHPIGIMIDPDRWFYVCQHLHQINAKNPPSIGAKLIIILGGFAEVTLLEKPKRNQDVLVKDANNKNVRLPLTGLFTSKLSAAEFNAMIEDTKFSDEPSVNP